MKRFGNILAALAAITAAILFVDWLNNHIDERVDQQISSEKTINAMSANIRPYVLFDQNPTILYDGGAMKYIDSLKVKVTFDTVDSHPYPMVHQVIIKPKQFMKIFPLLECIDITEHTYVPRRGIGYEITYDLINMNVGGLKEIRFRLEILK